MKEKPTIQQVENPFAHVAKLPLEEPKDIPCEECKGKDILIAALELELEGLRKRAYDVVGTFRELEAYLEKTNIDD